MNQEKINQKKVEIFDLDIEIKKAQQLLNQKYQELDQLLADYNATKNIDTLVTPEAIEKKKK